MQFEVQRFVYEIGVRVTLKLIEKMGNYYQQTVSQNLI
jgi:hypothetical protein